MRELKGVAVGAGYFSQFHLEAWSRLDGVQLVAICDTDETVARTASDRFDIERTYTDFEQMLDTERPDFVDIITRPDTHLGLVTQAADRGIDIICQKALAPTFEGSRQIVRVAEEAGVRLMVHENFRFQPWYREIRRQLDADAIGDLHALSFHSRMGDGWPEDAYQDRQPYFREMPRLLVFETGVHFIDSFRYLAGEIDGVYASLRRLNADIAGEDTATVMFEFASGAHGLLDGGRYNESSSPDARLTFGEALVEGTRGSIRLYGNGNLTLQRLGKPEEPIDYPFTDRSFAGDCVFATQKHFVDRVRDGGPFETSGVEYLKTLHVVEAVYRSAETRLPERGLVQGDDPCES
ncbi:MAG: Gfo/Idh/MocA family oxidoreductase [Planctomycetota bacterium]